MKHYPRLLIVLSTSLVASASSAQEEVGPSAPAGGDTQISVVPGPTTTTTTVQSTGPGHGELDGHLPSSSQSLVDINANRSGFDLNRSDPASASARGGKDAQYVLEGAGVPNAHTVRRGDTLWALSGQYYKNTYQWPKLWAQNPQIQNPHWIYPGDRLRLREESGASGPLRPRSVPEKTVFLRDYGWVDDPEKDAVGEVVGSHEDQMLLAHVDDVYIELHEDEKVELGQELTIYREVRTIRGREADDVGDLVAVIGTVRVDRYNPKTRMVRGQIIESLDAIERGDYVGAVGRKFHVVPPVKNEKYVEARIFTALYPHQLFGQNQVLFLDRGRKQGVKPGNRFLAVRRGDRWVESLDGAGPSASIKPMTEDDRDAIFDDIKTDGPDDKYPNETFGEVRVLAVRDNSSIAIVM